MLILNARSLASFALCFSLSPELTTARAQTSAKPPVRRSAPAAAGTARRSSAVPAKPVSSCVTVPVLSPRIPAVPSGSACAKSLYALKFEASHLDPQISAALRTNLESLNQSFSLDYIDTKIGTGELAQPKKFYTVNYTGYLVDGTKFDSSLDPGKEPFNFPYGAHRVIQGWDTGFEGMHAGGKRRLFVPYQLGYGDRGQPPTIPAKAVLVFDVEFLSQSDAPPAPKTPPPPPPPPSGTPDGTPPAGNSTPAGTTAPPAPGAPPTATPSAPPAPATKPATPPPSR